MAPSPPGLSRAAFTNAALTLLAGRFRRVQINGHSAAAGVGSSSAFAGSAGGRLASALLHASLAGRPLGGAVLGWEGCEVDPLNPLTNVNTGVGGFSTAYKDLAIPASTTLSAAIATTGAITPTITAATNFPTRWASAPVMGGVTITAPGNPFVIRIEHEEMLVTDISGTTLTVAASGRGWNGTIAAQHPSGAPVVMLTSAKGSPGIAGGQPAGSQTARPYLPWPVSGPNAGDVLPFYWWDLNDFFANCSTTFGSETNSGNSVANYAQAQRAYLSSYRSVISLARTGSVTIANAFRAAAEAVATLPAAGWGFYGSNGAAANTGGWASATGVDAQRERKGISSNYLTTATAGDFIEHNSSTDLSQDNVVAIHGLAQQGDSQILTFTVDGVTVGTLDTSQVSSPTSGRTSAWCFRFTKAVCVAAGVTAFGDGAAHRLRVTVTTQTAGRTRITAGCVESGIGSPVLVAGGFFPHNTISTNGINAGGNGPYADLADRTTKIAALITAVQTVVAEFAPYSGLPNSVLYVPVGSVLDPTNAAHYYIDGLHPSDLGYGLVAYRALQLLVTWVLASRNATALLSA